MDLDMKAGSFVPDTIHAFLKQLSLIADVSLRLDILNDFVTRLESELFKIHVFHRELPLCMLLLKDAILLLKQQTSQYTTKNAYQAVLEEFIPLNKESGAENMKINKADDEGDKQDKMNWMSSVQLWNADDSDSSMGDAKGGKIVGDDAHMSVSMNHTYRNVEKEKDALVTGLSLVVKQQDSIPRASNSKLGGIKLLNSSPPSNAQPTCRKQRRCWSAELHRRFVDALTKLGGAQVATPKQIRELMRIDGLTNDEVKSHLQKYRLHTQRVPSKSAKNEHSESSKPSSLQSGSPESPLQFPGLTAGDSLDDEDDEKSASYCRKGHVHGPGMGDV